MFKLIVSFLVCASLFASVESRIKYYNKYFVSDFLLNIYGPSIKSIIQENVLSRGDIFAGPCDPYSVIRGKEVKQQEHDCSQGLHEILTSNLGAVNPMRSVVMYDTCDKIVKNKRALKYSLNGVKSVKEYVEKFRGIKLSDSQLDTLKKNINGDWAKLSRLLCRMDEWQRMQ